MQRQMPSALLAEKNVIAAIFLEPELIVKASDLLTPHDFFDRDFASIFEAMLDLKDRDETIDFVSVTEYFNQNPKARKVGTDFIIALAEYSPSSIGFETSLELVLDASLKRSVIKAAGDIAEKGFTQNIRADDYLDDAERQIFDLVTMRRTSGFENIREVAQSYYDKTEKNRRIGSQITGLNTGFDSLNKITAGLQPEELIIIAARPGMGKSAFAVNLALNISKPKPNEEPKHVALFSLEMSNEQIVGRMLSNLSGIDNTKLRTGNLKSDEWKYLSFVVEQLGKHSIVFDDSASSKIGDLRAKSRQKRQEGKLDVIIIDYLQLLTADGRSSNRQEEVSKISRSLKQLAKELQVPVIALSQLSRRVEGRTSFEPILSDLRESGSIEQDADIVMFLHSDDYYNQDKTSLTGKMDVIIAKNRQGMQGRLHFTFEPRQSRFFPLEERDLEN